MSASDLEKRNVAWNALGEALWNFGGGLAAPLTVLPLLIRRLGGGNVEVGLVYTVASAGVLFPQVLSALIVQRGQGRKRFLLVYHWVLLIPLWAAIGAVLLFAEPTSPRSARTLIHVLFACFMVAMGFMFPLWGDWVAGLFRRERRGRAFGWANAAAAASGAVAAVLAAAVAGALRFPLSHAVLFCVGASFFCLSMWSFAPVRELAQELPHARFSRREMFARFRLSFVERNFNSYLVSRVLLTMGGGPIAFIAVHYKSRAGGGLSESTVIALGAAVTVAQMATGLVLGAVGDRVGHKLGVVVGAVAQLAALVVLMALPGAWACGAAFAFIGVSYASGWVSHQNLVFETCPHESRMAHIATSSLVVAPFSALVPVVIGQTISLIGIVPATAMSLAVTAAAVAWLLVRVREPRTPSA